MSTSLEYQLRRVKKPPTARQIREFRILAAVLIAIVLLAALLDLWKRRVSPYGGTDVLVFELCYLMLVVVSSGGLLAAWIVRIWKFDEGWPARFFVATATLIPLLIFLSTCTLNDLELPFHVAFSRSRSALELAAAQVRIDPSQGTVARNIGWLPVESIKADGASTTITIKGLETIDTNPFLQWSPGGPAPAGSYYGVVPLGNDWYWVNQ